MLLLSEPAEPAEGKRLTRTRASLDTFGSASSVLDLSGGFAELCQQLNVPVPPTSSPAGGVPGEALGKILDVLRGLRGERTHARVIERAAPELCAAGVFDRVTISHVRGVTWLPQTAYVFDGSGAAIREHSAETDDLVVVLVSPLPEAEVVRRRLPALVDNVEAKSPWHTALLERAGVTEYVVAPIVAASSVIGLVHADTKVSGRPLSSIERDLLRIFADGVGLAYECAGLTERIEQQRATMAEVSDRVMRSLCGTAPATPMVIRADAFRAPEVGERGRLPQPPVSRRLARLTTREREVLALLSSGATNLQLADRLTVAESTIKSHIKHILRKLGTGNRAGAIACYMREMQGDQGRSR